MSHLVLVPPKAKVTRSNRVGSANSTYIFQYVNWNFERRRATTRHCGAAMARRNARKGVSWAGWVLL
jgi:hypothetical protein